MKNRRNKLIILGIIVVLAAIGGKMYMDKQEAIRQERNQAVKEIQEQATKYIIENYVGIEKIEWRGWGIGAGPLSVNTSMTINGYPVNDGRGLFSYSAGHPEYIKKYTDLRFSIDESTENDPTKEVMEKELREQGVKKSKQGSINAEIIYNWEERK